MAKRATRHLDEKGIIGAILDEHGLDEAARLHLSECSSCRAEKETLANKLTRFGRMSRESAPLPKRKVRLSAAESRDHKVKWKVRPAWGMGLVFASLLALLLNPLFFKKSSGPNLEKVYLEMLQDEKFMAEIESLEENPLPRFYVDILGPVDGSDDMESKSPGGQDEKVT